MAIVKQEQNVVFAGRNMGQKVHLGPVQEGCTVVGGEEFHPNFYNGQLCAVGQVDVWIGNKSEVE